MYQSSYQLKHTLPVRGSHLTSSWNTALPVRGTPPYQFVDHTLPVRGPHLTSSWTTPYQFMEHRPTSSWNTALPVHGLILPVRGTTVRVPHLHTLYRFVDHFMDHTLPVRGPCLPVHGSHLTDLPILTH